MGEISFFFFSFRPIFENNLTAGILGYSGTVKVTFQYFGTKIELIGIIDPIYGSFHKRVESHNAIEVRSHENNNTLYCVLLSHVFKDGEFYNLISCDNKNV